MAAEVSFTAPRWHVTYEFANRILELCAGATIQKVAADYGINWHVIAKLKERAVRKALAQRERQPPAKVKNVAVDETSFRKHHDYSTIISDADRGIVLAVLPGRDAEPLKNFFATQTIADFSELRSISMDMAPPFIKAARESFPHADQIICYDRFHVAQLFSRAVDAIRRKESAAFERRRGENPLARTRFEWLRNNGKADNRTKRRRRFMPLTELPLLTAKAWRLKEQAAKLWGYAREGNAEKAWKRLLWRLSHSRIGELKKLYRTIKEHLRGILNAIRLRATNAAAEARNSCIQWVKYMACGFRNKERFHREIIFQFGGLDFEF
jgi:transposase